VLLVGLFRSIVPEGGEGPFGSQGGFVDTLAPEPYSLGTACLKAHADADPAVRESCEIELLNLSEPLELEDEREELEASESHVEAILARRPDVVAFSAYCWNVDAVAEIATRLRSRRADLTILVGGRATEGEPEKLLEDMRAVDALVVGEGEAPLRELLRRGLDPTGVPGLVHRRDGAIVREAGQVALEPLDATPSPLLTGIVAPRLHGVMMELGRGCLHACGYCTWNAHKRLRFHSPERIEAEVRWALEHGHRHITLTDSAVNYDTGQLGRVVEAIRRADPHGAVRFTYNVRHDSVTPEQVEILSRLPTHMVLLGVETLSPGALGHVDRAPADEVRLRSTLEALARATRPPVASIVLGLPGDSEQGFARTLETLLAWTRPGEDGVAAVGAVLVSLLQVYRGSTLWSRRGELGLRTAKRGIPYLLESPELPRESLARCKALLVRRMAEMPEALKAAEAVVLMRSEGGLDPWLAPDRVERLVRPWSVGSTHDGWTLEKVGVLRDTGGAASVRFRWQAGGGARVLLRRAEPGARDKVATEHYGLSVVPVGAPPPAGARRRLLRLVHAAVSRNERLVAAARARGRARSA
jgi:radical SAM superfamily enzyme YgiQ (UPF0313 family)